MTRLSEAIPRDRFERLPHPGAASGAVRRVGIEIEMAGMTERQVAASIVEAIGGTVVEQTAYDVVVEGSELGRLTCYLDTKYRKGKQHALSRLGLELGREVIPVELVTEPLAPDALPKVEALRETLRRAGAIGSRDGMLLSFGLHLNVEVAGADPRHWRPVLTAFALLEDWLRFADPIDGSRRLLPFVDPYPRAFVRALLELDQNSPAEQIIDLYLRQTPTRNRSLDMLPFFANLDPELASRTPVDLGSVSARPTYHYRLPDSRIDEPDWRIAYEWNRWVLVERVAQDDALISELSSRWRSEKRLLRHEWCADVETILSDAGLGRAAA